MGTVRGGRQGVGATITAADQAQPNGHAVAAVLPKRRIGTRYGGVNAKLRTPSIQGVEVLVKPRPVAPAALAYPGFVYNGGPVVTCPLVYTSFWGSLWLADPAHLERAGRLSQFHQDLLRSDMMNVLSQYGVGFGAGSGLFIGTTFVSNVPNTLTDSGGPQSIQGILQSCIDAGVLPEPSNPSNNVIIIYLDENTDIDDPQDGLVLCEAAGDTAFGYHNFFMTTSGNPCYYAIIPGLNDACLSDSCPGDDAGCSLHLSESQEERQTQVASHEFAEMTTDPQLNAWYDPSNGENGDICNGESDLITLGADTWTVQKIYSKYDDTITNGAIYCVSQTPSPEPALSPGPTARPATLARARRLQPTDRLTPLPTLTYDASSGKVAMEDAELQRYVRKLFYPYRPEHIIPNFSDFLRGAADILEKK